MKLISLNIWEGVLYQPLVNFLNNFKSDINIFCFQEVFKNEQGIRNPSYGKIITFESLKEILIDFNGYFEDYIAPGEYKKQGLSTFIKKNLRVKDKGEIFIYNPAKVGFSNNDPRTLWRNLQYLQCELNDEEFLIANMHGLFDLATKNHKDDLPERIEQSKKVKDFLSKFNCPKILCGDLNLWPDTKSLKILEEGMINLIKEYNIFSTRSSFFKHENKFADYILVSPDIRVADFKVLQEPVSDHLPLFLDFSAKIK